MHFLTPLCMHLLMHLLMHLFMTCYAVMLMVKMQCSAMLRMPVCMQSDLSAMQDDVQCYMPCRMPVQFECGKSEMKFTMQDA